MPIASAFSLRGRLRTCNQKPCRGSSWGPIFDGLVLAGRTVREEHYNRVLRLHITTSCLGNEVVRNDCKSCFTGIKHTVVSKLTTDRHSYWGEVHFQLQIQNRAARTIKFHYRNGSVNVCRKALITNADFGPLNSN